MKMKSKIIKIIVAILIVITLFAFFSQTSLASFVGDIDTKFVGTKDKGNATSTIAEIMGKAINVIQVVGCGISILMLVVLGIKWIYSSPSDKAQIQAKEVRYYIMGVIFIFAAVGLLQIVKTFTTANIASQGK